MSWSALLESESLTDETIETREVHLQDGKVDHGVEFVVTGTGSIAVTPYTSISGRDWVSNGEKVNGFGSESGPGTNGKQILPLLLKPSEFLKFSIVITGAVILTMWFTQK